MDRLTKKDSFGSLSLSPITETVIVLELEPAGNVSVPLVGT